MQKVHRRRFTDDFKSQAVLLADSLGRTAAARKLDMSVKTLAHWVADAPTIAPAPSSRRRNVGVVDAELSQLRAENATLRMERGILASYIHGFYNPLRLHSSHATCHPTISQRH